MRCWESHLSRVQLVVRWYAQSDLFFVALCIIIYTCVYDNVARLRCHHIYTRFVQVWKLSKSTKLGYSVLQTFCVLYINFLCDKTNGQFYYLDYPVWLMQCLYSLFCFGFGRQYRMKKNEMGSIGGFWKYSTLGQRDLEILCLVWQWECNFCFIAARFLASLHHTCLHGLCREQLCLWRQAMVASYK